jgi:tRNA(fMet)-specific endonuclease VapC
MNCGSRCREVFAHTNTFIDQFRKGAASNVTTRLAAAATGSVYVCSVVLAELYYGAVNSPLSHQAANLALIVGLRKALTSLPFNDDAAEIYGKLRVHLNQQGTPIGPNDLLIASIAIANQVTLVTNNVKEFNRVPGLVLETWH